MTRFRDITLPIRDDMVVYPGDPEVEVEPHSSLEEGDDANVTWLALGSHTGTHMDAPRHFIENGRGVDDIAPARLIGPARVVQVPDDVTAIGPEHLRDALGDGVARILLRTRNRHLLDLDHFSDAFAFLTADAARHLVDAGVDLVGIDYLSIEDPDADEPRAHHLLLENDVVILEGLDLRDVEPGDYELLCLPLRIEGGDGAPVRAFLRDPE